MTGGGLPQTSSREVHRPIPPIPMRTYASHGQGNHTEANNATKFTQQATFGRARGFSFF